MEQNLKENNLLPFLDVQTSSFNNFFFSKKKNEDNLKNVLNYCLNFDVDDRFVFSLIDYKIDKKEINQEEEIEIQKKSSSYNLKINVNLNILDKKHNTNYQKSLLLCEVPCITNKGEFLINGVYRVVVPHLLRIKGIFLSLDSVTKEYNARVRTMYGKKIEFSTQTKSKNGIVVKLENNKFNWAVALNALFFNNFIELFDFIFEKKEIQFDFNLTKDEFINLYSNENILTFNHLDTDIENILISNKKALEKIFIEKTEKAQFYVISKENMLILEGVNNSFFDSKICSKYMYNKMRNSIILGQSQDYLKKTFFNTDFFSLGYIGRYVINRKFGTNFDDLVLRKEDVKNILFYLLNLNNNKPGYQIDDQYSLTNLYVHTVGQYLANDIRSITLNLKRNLIEKTKVLSRKEKEEDISKEINSTNFINLSKIGSNTKIQKFFLLHPSSQFLSQINPLSSLMHKTKINTMNDSTNSTSDFASFESRNLQKSFYSRLCCITTPDSKMVGLVNFAAIYSKIDKNGFIQSPYNKVVNGKILDEIVFLNSFQEENEEYYIADFTSRENNRIKGDFVNSRYKGNISLVNKERINLIDSYRNQTISLSSCLIPFFEHNDNTRASMGSNMMKQIIPSIFPEKPMVTTGFEKFVVEKSGYNTIAENDGVVEYADGKLIKVKYKNNLKEYIKQYKVFPFFRTNQNTLAYTKNIVEPGQKIKKGDLLTESFCSNQGKLSLGKNLLTAVFPYEGLNFEDAIVISEKCVNKKMFDSYVLTEIVTTPEKTKLGYEKITKSIPYLEEELKQLDENGIVKLGSIVKKGDILVGKITPEIKEHTNKNDEKIMNIVFGEDILNYRNTSVKYNGDMGEVLDIIFINNTNKVTASKKPPTIKITIGEKKPIKVGDKICGRYGNKNIISKIIPECDMPYLSDGRICEAVINPLGIVSRMNIGQLLEMNLTLSMKELGIQEIEIKPYERDSILFIKDMLARANLPEDGKISLFDGKTDEVYEKKVTVGYLYTMPMEHKVDNKFNSRSVGSYSTITQQPLAGRSNKGGQKTGQMELWCLEAFGAKSTILEKTSVLSDDMLNKRKLIKNMIFGGNKFKFGRTSTFNFFIQLLKSLSFKSELDISKKDINEEDLLLNNSLEQNIEEKNRVANNE